MALDADCETQAVRAKDSTRNKLRAKSKMPHWKTDKEKPAVVIPEDPASKG